MNAEKEGKKRKQYFMSEHKQDFLLCKVKDKLKYSQKNICTNKDGGEKTARKFFGAQLKNPQCEIKSAYENEREGREKVVNKVKYFFTGFFIILKSWKVLIIFFFLAVIDDVF
jgi:hypothetical protein